MRHRLVPIACATLLFTGPAVSQVWEVDNYMASVNRGTGAALGHSVAVGDFDDDGRKDWVVGAPDPADSAGAFFVGFGSADRDPPSALGHVSSQNLYGLAVVAGDFDGDGRDEIAVGAPGTDLDIPSSITDFGNVDIWHWESGELQLLQSVSQFVTDGSAPEEGDQFGRALAAGDFDNDGYDDLAVGVPLEDYGFTEDTGVVHVFYGSSTGLSTDTDVMFRSGVGGIQGTESAGDHFGHSLTVGDFDGDAFDDLAIGVPYRDAGGAIDDTGEVHVLYGSSLGLLSAGNQLFDDTDFGSVWATGERFGWVLAAGRLDDTALSCFSGCYDDLVVGVPFHFAGGQQLAGKVLVAYGSSSGLSTTGFTELTQPADPSADTNDYFGYALAVGHLDRRGPGNFYAHEDLAVSAIGEDVGGVANAGKVHLFFGSSTGIGGGQPPQTTVQRPGLESAPAGQDDEIGRALAIGDLDGDGWGDLVIGIPDKDVSFSGQIATFDAGAIQVLYGALFADGFEQGTTGGWNP